MTEDDQEMGEATLKKRRLAAKGIKERSDGKAVDPLADMESLDPDDKTMTPKDPVEEIAEKTGIAAVPGLALIRNG